MKKIILTTVALLGAFGMSYANETETLDKQEKLSVGPIDDCYTDFNKNVNMLMDCGIDEDLVYDFAIAVFNDCIEAATSSSRE
ncbi:MAG: hypothetical protein Q4B43_03250 [Bacteroidota bacterium]|nr:hypothetical protein [Bacteroidota bacterium]